MCILRTSKSGKSSVLMPRNVIIFQLQKPLMRGKKISSLRCQIWQQFFPAPIFSLSSCTLISKWKQPFFSINLVQTCEIVCHCRFKKGKKMKFGQNSMIVHKTVCCIKPAKCSYTLTRLTTCTKNEIWPK